MIVGGEGACVIATLGVTDGVFVTVTLGVEVFVRVGVFVPVGNNVAEGLSVAVLEARGVCVRLGVGLGIAVGATMGLQDIKATNSPSPSATKDTLRNISNSSTIHLIDPATNRRTESNWCRQIQRK